MKRIFSLFASALLAISAWAVELQVSYEYVDLGLSVKWATCNLGATSSTDAGWYLAWGETSPKTNYTWATYLSDLDGTMTSWEDAGTEKDPLKEYVYGGANYSKGIGGTAYDAATAALGAGYRMPTQKEFEELANTDNCEWVWCDEDNTEFNGVAGYKVTSKKTGYTGNSIFIPAAGCRYGEGLDLEGSYGIYWSSTLDSGDASGAYYLDFGSDYVSPDYYDYRCNGFPVRPVYAAPIAQITIGEETTKYYSVENFREKFYYIDEKAYVKLLGDITLSDFDFENEYAGADITLDLNGHSITGNNDDGLIIDISEGALTITGEGTIENTAEYGVAILSAGTLTVKGGTYKSALAACGVAKGAELIIDGGQFDSEALYYTSAYFTKPIVKGGIFSMDPSDCVAEGYAAVPNDDEATKADYPYKVVEKPLTPTAIDAVNADKAGKALKTLKNGRVVIIRDNKKFDLSGREL
ncbi:MAG: hypothetical protein MJZ27_09155 [Bacteroidales bacterium]|nr:hypothetical protein [Bacteroidales bacterium]